jgi:hypothetical protein
MKSKVFNLNDDTCYDSIKKYLKKHDNLYI